MRLAPIGGGSARPNEVGAPRRQTESPLKTSSSENGYSARRSKDQDPNKPPKSRTPDSSRPIANPGHAKKCIKAIRRIVLAEGYQAAGPRDIFLAVAWLEDTAAAADPSYERTLDKFALRYLRGFGLAAQADALAELRAYPRPVTPRSLGELLCLTSAKREQFKFTLAEPIDMTLAEIAKAKNRESKARGRRARGIPERGMRIAEAKRCEPDTPIKTLYDRLQHGRKPRRKASQAGSHSEISSCRGSPFTPQNSETSSCSLL